MNAVRERLNSLAWSKSGGVMLKAALVVLAGIIIWSKWREQQPLEVHLRDVFKETGGFSRRLPGGCDIYGQERGLEEVHEVAQGMEESRYLQAY